MTTDEYDFVIVGGGTSGLVVATRLSEDPNVQVLVVEAGENYVEDPRVKIPALYETLKHTEADWSFTTEPQVALKERQISLSQGRALGGSSAINAHVFVPPSRTVIDAWEKLGNPGWNWDALKPYYVKAHSLKPLQPELRERFGLHWQSDEAAEPSGPIQTSYTGNLEDPIPKAWIDTFKSLGYLMAEDPFSGDPMGAFSCLASIDPVSKERSYTATAYYVPAAERQNLHVLTGSTAKKILFATNEANLRATGVQFHRNEDLVTAKARKEVILAAGSLQSPKMLELSGIGAAKLLHSYNIDLYIDNPHVGENLQDHIVCSIAVEAKEHVSTLDDLVRRDPKALEAAMGEYIRNKTGPFTSVGVSSYAFLPILEFLSESGQSTLRALLDRYAVNTNPAHPAPGLYYDIARSILENKNEASGAFLTVATQTIRPIDTDSTESPLGPVAGKFITLGAMLSQPLSRGSVHIASADPSTKPTINPNYLTHPLDIELFARHMQYLEIIAVSEPFRSLLKEDGRRIDSKSYVNSLDAAKDYIRSRAISMWHPTSTCALMPRDKGGVVNEHLIVHGTSNLRVVDASVIPLIPRANIQSTVYAVAERAADLIKAEYAQYSG